MNEKDYEALCDMFLSDGWKIYIDDITDLEKTLTQVAPDAAVTGDQWQYARGKIHTLRNNLGFENYVKLAWEQAEQNKLFDAADLEDVVDVDAI